MERELPLLTRLRMRLHLLLCPPCKRYARQVTFMHDALRDLFQDLRDEVPGTVGLSDEARQRLKASLRAGLSDHS
jgi:hypothetical protein